MYQSLFCPFKFYTILKTLATVTGNISPLNHSPFLAKEGQKEEGNNWQEPRSGKKRSKAVQSSPPPSETPGPSETGRGSFTTGLNAGNSFVNCRPPKMSSVTFDMFNIPFILPEIFFLQPKINKNNDTRVILIGNRTVLKREDHIIFKFLFEKGTYNKCYVNVNNDIKRTGPVLKCPVSKGEVYQPGRQWDTISLWAGVSSSRCFPMHGCMGSHHGLVSVSL